MNGTSYCIYEKETTLFVRVLKNRYWQDADNFKTEAAAKAAFTRLTKAGKVTAETHAIAETGHFHKNIEKQETRVNLLSGKEFTQPVNTPACCDPSTETYHCM